ncbi:MAG: hypothetical protein OXG11_13780, partial [Chloroflexi bacterium]|nr:hypothetical protein [Chloroflexota bacterium]
MSTAIGARAMTPPPPPPASTVGYVGWLRKNLFSSWSNGILTVVLAVGLAWAAVNIFGWLIFTADWEVITSRVPLYIVGLYPAEDYWRPQVCVLLISTLLGISWRNWGGTARVFAVGFGAIILILAVLPHEMEIFNRILLLLNPVAVGFGYFAARPLGLHNTKRMIAVSISIVVVSLLLIRGIEGVPGLEP